VSRLRLPGELGSDAYAIGQSGVRLDGLCRGRDGEGGPRRLMVVAKKKLFGREKNKY